MLLFISLMTGCMTGPVGHDERVVLQAGSGVAEGVDGIDIISHSLVLEVDTGTGALTGEQVIFAEQRVGHTGALVFSKNPMSVSKVRMNGRTVEFNRKGEALRLALQDGPGALRIEISYSGRPQRTYSVVQEAIYTGYFACEWMFCQQEDFGDTATIRLELVLPEKLETIGPGQLLQAGFDGAGKWRAVHWLDFGDARRRLGDRP